MKGKFLALIIFSFISIAGYTNDNFYIKIKRNKIEIGEYIGEKHSLKTFKTYDKENLDLDEINSFLELKNKNLLFYFHGIQSNDILNQKYALKRLEKINNADVTVSVIWKSKSWVYTSAWKKAIHQGEEIADLIESVIVNYDKTSVLCHSMGHRLLEGIYLKKNQKFDKIFFAAPDLDMDVFEKNFKNLPDNCNKLFIYTNT